MTEPQTTPDSEFDFIIRTDGSGVYTDDYGGSSVYTTDQATGLRYLDVAGSTGNNTHRAEVSALLLGLRRASLILQHTSASLQGITRTVRWYCDREAAVTAVNSKSSRKAEPDLFAQLEYYEKTFKVYAVFEPRETEGAHQKVDRFCHEFRNMVRDWCADVGRVDPFRKEKTTSV